MGEKNIAKPLYMWAKQLVGQALKKEEATHQDEKHQDEKLVQSGTRYGSAAAGLYDEAAKLNAQARTLYLQSSDTYFKSNDAAAYDDWIRARAHWDYFYHRSLLQSHASIAQNEDCSSLAKAILSKEESKLKDVGLKEKNI